MGLAIEEPWREMKHSAVHFPIVWQDVVMWTAGFGWGNSVPGETHNRSAIAPGF